MRLSEEEISSVRSQSDIVDIVGRYLPLVKKGKSFAAVCPFHDDHSPSLSLSQEKQIYKCFVCGAGGNVFTFVQNYEHISFPEAVVKVAEHIGYDLQYQPGEFVKKQDPYKEAGYKVMNEAIQYMMYSLDLPSASHEREYLKSRGIGETLIKMFEIGFNEPEDHLHKFLSAKGYTDQDMISTNLVRISETGLHDTFSSRITFPIHDNYGNPVGFTARTLNPDIPSKYINTTETDFYVKGNIVYNLHRAKPYAKKINSTILVEGVTDVLAFAKVGIFNVCATLGTAGTKEQLKQLKACSTQLVFCYDGDNAGKNATYRVGKLAKELGFEVLVASNKTEYDPDDIVEKFGEDELKRIVGKPQAWMEFIFDYFQSKSDLENYSDKKEFAQSVMEEIKNLHDDFDRQNFTHRLTQLTGFNLSAIEVKEERKSPSQIVDRSRKIHVPQAIGGRETAEKIILSQMLLDKDAVEIFKNKLGFMTDKNYQQIAMMILEEYRKADSILIADFLDKVLEAEESKKLDRNTREQVIQLSTAEEFPQEYSEEVLLGAITRVKKSLLEDKVNVLQQKIKEINNADSRDSLLQEYKDSLIELRRYNDEEENI